MKLPEYITLAFYPDGIVCPVYAGDSMQAALAKAGEFHADYEASRDTTVGVAIVSGNTAPLRSFTFPIPEEEAVELAAAFKAEEDLFEATSRAEAAARREAAQ